MEKAWLAHYPEGVPVDINPDAYPSIQALFHETVHRFSDRPAFRSFGTDMTYRELEVRSRHLAAYFQSTLKMKKGDRIAIMMPNCLQYAVALFAAFRAGLVVVNVNPLYTPDELKHQLNDSGATAIVIMQNFAVTLQKVIGETDVRHVLVSELGDQIGGLKGAAMNLVVKYVKKMIPPWTIPEAKRFNQAIADGAALPLDEPALTGDDIAFLQYTGGTTGVSKGAVLSHRNMIANVEQAHAWIRPGLPSEQVHVVTALPLYHIFALTANMLLFFKEGALNLLITNPRDIPDFIKQIRDYRLHFFSGVNTLFNALNNHPDFLSVDFSRLIITLGGGMAVQKVVADRWKEITGCTLLEAYGLTETSPAVCINPPSNTCFNGSIGLPISSTDVRICDESGRALPVGEVGELCVRGPQVMQGYWNRPDETAKVMLEDGWLRTGDIATLDEAGYVRLVDRKKDIIIVSGFNVYPNEIEDVISKHPGVLEVAVIGVECEDSGERPKAFVVKKDQEITVEAILDYCREHLTRYKIPKEIEFRAELPKTNVGKILRRALKEEHKKTEALQEAV